MVAAIINQDVLHKDDTEPMIVLKEHHLQKNLCIVQQAAKPRKTAEERHVRFSEELQVIPPPDDDKPLTKEEHYATFYTWQEIQLIVEDNEFTLDLYRHHRQQKLNWQDDDLHYCIRGLKEVDEKKAMEHVANVLRAQRELQGAGLACNLRDVSCNSSNKSQLEAISIARKDALMAARDSNQPEIGLCDGCNSSSLSFRLGCQIQKLRRPCTCWRGINISTIIDTKKR